MIKSGLFYLEHISIAVMSVLHHHRLGSGQSVRDAVLVFVAYGLMGHKEGMVDDNRGREWREEDKTNCRCCHNNSLEDSNMV